MNCIVSEFYGVTPIRAAVISRSSCGLLFHEGTHFAHQPRVPAHGFRAARSFRQFFTAQANCGLQTNKNPRLKCRHRRWIEPDASNDLF